VGLERSVVAHAPAKVAAIASSSARCTVLRDGIEYFMVFPLCDAFATDASVDCFAG
jgi:hypothetical protein